MLPMPKTRPPTTRNARTWPEYGSTRFARSCARIPDSPTTRQTLSWMARSITTLATIAAANEGPYLAVNVPVWEMNPGPAADIAMRNIAPATATERFTDTTGDDGVAGPEGAVPGSVPGPAVSDAAVSRSVGRSGPSVIGGLPGGLARAAGGRRGRRRIGPIPPAVRPT